MHQHFREIKEKYDTFYKSLLKRGQLPVRSTGVGYWGASVSDEVYSLFRQIFLERFNNFLDLGSGDGKVVMLASLFTNATGIEYDPWLVDVSHRMKEHLSHIPHVKRANFVHKNFMHHQIEDFDIVFCSPDKPFHRGLEEKLLKELNGRLIVYGSHFLPRKLDLEKEFDIDGTLVRIYKNGQANRS